jgi:hypothetical protein
MTGFYRMLRGAFPFMVGGVLATMGCSLFSGKTNPPREEGAAEQPTAADIERADAVIAAATAGLPKTLVRPATLKQSAEFAWQQFLTLNHVAAQPDGKSTSRGTVAQPAKLGQPGELLVWQTYAHRTELRPNGPLSVPWDSLGVPTYDNAYKMSLVKGTPDARLDLWNNLDEDSEIGSCQLFGQYEKQPGELKKKSLVLFEAKVNRDEYEFIRQNYGSDQYIGNKGPNADPAKCDASSPSRGALCEAQLRLRTNIANGKYDNTAQCDCPKEQAICLPCETSTTDGTIEIKAAWRKLLPNDKADRYYTSKALYYQYEYDPVSKSYQYKYYNDTFALIGLHIIRKLQNYPTFVFTTFEQVDESVAGDQYVITDTDGAEVSPPTPAVRQTGNNLDRKTNHEIPGDIQTVNLAMQQILKKFSNSVWQYYRLAGVQAEAIDCPIADAPPPKGTAPEKAGNDCIKAQDKNVGQCLQMDPNYYMANLFIETDPFLNNFSGPGFGGNTFGSCQNTLYQKKPLNMGGCKGCHGVAQTAFGTDFSFLLDIGNGKPATAPDTLRPPAAELAGIRVSSSKVSVTPEPGSKQVCQNAHFGGSAALKEEGCVTFCRQACDAKDCIAFNASAAGCEIFPQDVPMSSLTLQPVDGYQAFLLPGTQRPPPSGGGKALEVLFPARYLHRSEKP